MPILDSLDDHDVVGPILRRGREEGQAVGLAEGREEGRAVGLAEGREEGRITALRRILSRFIERRFGSVPAWAQDRLNAMTAPQLDEALRHILDAPTLEDVFR